jgi:hypothetical protein
MRNTLRLLLPLGVFVLSSCGESKAPHETTGATESTSTGMSLVEEAKTLAEKTINKVETLDWESWKNKLTQVDLSQAKKALDGIDISAAKAKYDELAGALARKDYVQAEFYAKQFDALLSSDVAGRTIEFLKLESEKGTDAAITAVREYLNTPGLGQSSKEFGEKMLAHLQSVEQKQVEGVLCFIVYYAVDSKVRIEGPHGQNLAAVLAVAAVSTGFDAYDLHAKEGVELSEAILRTLGTNKNDATKAWNEIVQASKKGVNDIKEELTEKSAQLRAQEATPSPVK